MAKETLKSIKNSAYHELLHYMEWVVKNYPEVHEHYMLTCHICGKKFVNAIAPKTGKINKYLWKPNCDCLSEDLRLSKGCVNYAE